MDDKQLAYVGMALVLFGFAAQLIALCAAIFGGAAIALPLLLLGVVVAATGAAVVCLKG